MSAKRHATTPHIRNDRCYEQIRPQQNSENILIKHNKNNNIRSSNLCGVQKTQ